ncbi:MAG: hypothetical protein ABI882_19630 [Acidobacteriota bacterium]
MFRKRIVLAMALLALGLSACAGEDKTGGSASPAPAEEIVYEKGFYDLERDPNMSWRWMEPEGVVRLKNSGKDMTLKLAGRAPLERFKQPPVINISLNGVQLEQVTGTPEGLDREYTISAAQQGKGEWSELKITSDQSFVPKEVDKGGTDPRRLAFSLTNLTWQPK